MTAATTSTTAIESHFYRLPSGGVAPSGRFYSACAFDATLNRFVVIGGTTGGVGRELYDMWALDFTTSQWSNLQVASSPAMPTGRSGISGASLAVAPNFGKPKYLLFGGQDSVSISGDLWQYDTYSLMWSLIQPAPPPNGLTASRELAPAPRARHYSWVNTNGAGFTSISIFGGANANGYLTDMWTFEVASNKWTPYTQTGSLRMPTSAGFNCALAPGGAALWCMPGAVDKTRYSNVVSIQKTIFSFTFTVGQNPPSSGSWSQFTATLATGIDLDTFPVSGSCLFFYQNYLFLLGGQGSSVTGFQSSLFQATINSQTLAVTWSKYSKFSVSAIVARLNPYCEVTNAVSGITTQSSVVMFGGTNPGAISDTYLMQFEAGPTEILAQIGSASTTGARIAEIFPSARTLHAMALFRSTIVLFGGQDATGTFLKDVWIGYVLPAENPTSGSDMSKFSWISPNMIVTSGAPGARTQSAMVSSTGVLWLFGGFGAGPDGVKGALGDFWNIRHRPEFSSAYIAFCL